MPDNPIQTYQKNNFTISTNPSRLDQQMIHNFLTSSYWAKGRPFEMVEKSIRHSLCFGVYTGDRQIGLGRVITDRTTFAYLADVFIIEEFQGQGLGKWLKSCILSHPDLQDVPRTLLATADAPYGFEVTENPDRLMNFLTKY